jgi:hypothetical protein
MTLTRFTSSALIRSAPTPMATAKLDGAEVIAGMNPLDPASFFAVLPGNQCRQRAGRGSPGPASNGRLYTLLYSSDSRLSAAGLTWRNTPTNRGPMAP